MVCEADGDMFGSGAEASEVAREARHNYLNAMGANANAVDEVDRVGANASANAVDEVDGAGAGANASAAGPVGAGASAAGPVGNAVVDQGLAPRLLFKVVMAGESGVGKTSLLQSFCGRPFDARSDPTIGVDFCTRKLSCFPPPPFNVEKSFFSIKPSRGRHNIEGRHAV